MGDFASSCTDWVMSVFEAQVGAAQAVTGEAYALACEQHVGLDGVDREVLTDTLVGASLHLSSLIKAMLPEGADGPDAVAAVVARHRPRVEWRASDTRRYMASLLRVGVRHSAKARRLLERFTPAQESRVLKSISFVHSNLRIAHYLVDARCRPSETLEAALRECRNVVRLRHGGGDEVAAS
ncbi:MAG: hypothetical protein ACRDKJ_00130 [Actinomycetota bacterium]